MLQLVAGKPQPLLPQAPRHRQAVRVKIVRLLQSPSPRAHPPHRAQMIHVGVHATRAGDLTGQYCCSSLQRTSFRTADCRSVICDGQRKALAARTTNGASSEPSFLAPQRERQTRSRPATRRGPHRNHRGAFTWFRLSTHPRFSTPNDDSGERRSAKPVVVSQYRAPSHRKTIDPVHSHLVVRVSGSKR